ncbi:MAG: hypothetical protein K8R40_02355 [Anaerolineaceae bacterium]|nr:hypothetical protein [Anaerolineaceae bacterium]
MAEEKNNHISSDKLNPLIGKGLKEIMAHGWGVLQIVIENGQVTKVRVEHSYKVLGERGQSEELADRMGDDV